jgi:hypothetical protein
VKPAARAKKKRPQPKPVFSSAAKAARFLVGRAVCSINFVHSAIPTRLIVKADGLHVQIDSFERETGDEVVVDLRYPLPPLLTDRDHAVDWIYAQVRDAWVHELNEALFVDGFRRRNLHDANGQTIPPPEDAARGELHTFKTQLAAFLMGTGTPQ